MGKLSAIRSRASLIGHVDVENAAKTSHVDESDEERTTTMRGRRGRVLVLYAARNSGYIFFACVFFLFMRAGYLGSSESSLLSYEPGVDEQHPIPRLMEEAEGRYRQKLGRQSRTLRAAVGEYKRRYGRAPPRGFDGWWAFAVENGVKFVDEYDGLVEDLAPFWSLEGREVRRRIGQVSKMPSVDVVRIKDGAASTLRLNSFEDAEVSARANGFRDMISRFAGLLPDMDFTINAKAEGRVLVPWEHRARASDAAPESRPDWGTDGNVWEAWRRTCPPTSPARRLFSSLRSVSTAHPKSYLAPNASADFSFVPSTAAHTLDFCAAPHAHYTHGHFFSDWRTLPALYPVFSPARAAGFMDIRIPSHYYYGSTARYTYGWDPVNLELTEHDPMEVPWADKKDTVFWRGATTGGGNHPPGFAMQYQRHRFLRMASDNSSTPHPLTFALPSASSPPIYTTHTLPLSTLNTIFDAAFTKAVSPESYPGGLPSLLSTHRFADAVPLGAHWAHKYLVDIDGMGYSGRFMAFLASDSVPLKATVYKEFFDTWIEPWLHFVPLSSSYTEIYNIHAYFSGPSRAALEFLNASSALDLEMQRTDQDQQQQQQQHGDWTRVWRPAEGDRRLRRIARAGKEWKKTVGRTVDMEVYVYRLALEWARLCADDRDAMAFDEV